MRIETFAYVDKVVGALENKRSAFAAAATDLVAFLEQALHSFDEVVGVTERIKTSASLREKIVRNGLYKQYAADDLLYMMSDIIGVRIECRFLADEARVYQMICALFSEDRGEGYRTPEGRSDYALKLDAPQPERQKNGLNIYRIDGFVERDGVRYNFELQIKSLVNSFWSEIEHKLIYKNKRFMMIDRFVNDMMLSIYESLVNIDAQLNMIYSRCFNNNNVDEQIKQIENVLTVLINEVYTNLIEEKVGFGVNIKDYSESLVKYILYYSSFIRHTAGPDELYGNTVMNVMNWMRKVDFDAIEIGEEIVLPDEIPYENNLQRAIGETLLAHINDDFYLNTFFHIFFSIEVGNDAQDFLSYVKYYEKRIALGADPARRILLKDRLRRIDSDRLVLEKTIEALKK